MPVLREEVLSVLRLTPGERLLDLTLGPGGHARAFLEAVDGRATIIGLDADAENIALARETLREWTGRVTFLHANFRDLATLECEPVDVLFADLGVSSPHLDDPTRGFTFRADAPLDLRFDRSSGKSAAERLRKARPEDVASVLRRFGELPRGAALASVLCEKAQASASLLRTGDIRRAAQEIYGYKEPQVLPQIFQALRIWVNDEIGALEALLQTGPSLLRPGGRMGVISYHSLEDRLVKQTFRVLAAAERDERTGQDVAPALFELLTKKAVRPSEREVGENPRSRSAKFRAIRRRP
jgi:16S rRNA (cytosine1402-N4)-methyltransferase